MLTSQEIHEIQEESKLYPDAAGACLDALKIVQKYRGWVSDDSIEDIAAILSLSPERVDGVATFYSRIYRRKVGRHVILICDGMSCMIMGYEGLYQTLKRRLGISWGETTPDARFTLLPISCLGDCDHAPSMMIDNELFGNVTSEKLNSMLEKYT